MGGVEMLNKKMMKTFSELAKAQEEEINAKLSEKEKKNLLKKELDFNKEIQLFVMDKIENSGLTSNFVVGTLFKLAWQITNQDFMNQMTYLDKFIRGGR